MSYSPWGEFRCAPTPNSDGFFWSPLFSGAEILAEKFPRRDLSDEKKIVLGSVEYFKMFVELYQHDYKRAVNGYRSDFYDGQFKKEVIEEEGN